MGPLITHEIHPENVADCGCCLALASPINVSWLTPTVRRLAEGIHKDRAFNRLPILADALEEAGCTSQDILNHCREPGKHDRVCWAVDLVHGKAGGAQIRDSIGGFPIIPKSVPYPQCRCGERMALFLQFDVPKEFGLPLVPNSHLSVFQCPEHVWPPRGLGHQGSLAPEFWLDHNNPEKFPTEASYCLILHKPDEPETVYPQDPFLIHHTLWFEKRDEEIDRNDEERTKVEAISRKGFPGTSAVPWSVSDSEGTVHNNGLGTFKVGGQPDFCQDTENQKCACGADMILLCQIPDRTFNTRTSFTPIGSSSNLGLDGFFNSLFVQIVACERQCSPFALEAEGQR